MTLPKISIITPSLNQSKFIEQTIKSVLNQNYPNLEYIVVDGGSVDSTIKILKKYSKQIKWVSEKDKGQADAINKGMRMAKGDIVAYINSDDYYLPGAFTKIADFFMKNSKAKWVTGDYIIVNEEDKKIQQSVTLYKRLMRFTISKNLLAIANYIAQPSTFWRESIFREIGFFDVSFEYVFDYDFWMRIIAKYPLFKIPSPLSAFRVHSRAKGSTGFARQFAEELLVTKRYEKNPITLSLHKLHNQAIVGMYNLIKN